MRKRGAVTISDVAESVGVATSTVSRAFTHPGRISEPMRQRVLAAASELGYQPNPQARSLTSGRTQSIALVVSDVTNPFFFGLVKGAQAQAKARGYRQILVDTEESAEVEAAALAEVAASVDGVIVAASRLPDAGLVAAAERVPLVVINRELVEVPCVVTDTAMGTTQALDHLVSLGHTDVAYLSGPATSWSNRRRQKALQTAARRLGVGLHPIGPFESTIHSGAAAADAALRQGVTAAVFFNDLLAIGALRRFAERGVRVPEDFSVVGCDDIFGADFCNPPLTTVTVPIEAAGRVATDILISVLQSDQLPAVAPRRRETLPTHLTIRRSTGVAPAGAPARR